MQPVIQTFKKVINSADAGVSADASRIYPLSEGKDSVAAGQTSAVDVDVPTGSIIKFIDIFICVTNLVAISCFTSVAIQLVHIGQGAISPLSVGGSGQRNQVFHQDFFSVGKEQNLTRRYRFKVPKRFQRVREADKWQIVTNSTAATTQAGLAIYKFYR